MLPAPPACHRDQRRARALLAANRRCLDDLAASAIERETLSREELDEIFAAHDLSGEVEMESLGTGATVSLAREGGESGEPRR
jgi:hypothetical protein